MHEPYLKAVSGAQTAVLMIHGIVGTPDHFKNIIPSLPDSVAVHNILSNSGHFGYTPEDEKTVIAAVKAMF